LCLRNVPICDEGFEEIVLDRIEGRVVGIQVLTSKGQAGRGIVLVDKDGKICANTDDIVTVQMANTTSFAPSVDRSSQRHSSSSVRSSSSTTSSTASTNEMIDTISNELLIQYGLMAIGALLILKLIFTALNMIILFALPVIYLYASANCPSNDTFDAKKELKRVMRGAHLPEEHQPKGFFEKGVAKLTASITTEIATSLGYEIRINDYFGIAKMASVKVPVSGPYEYYWIGIFDRWRYMGQREIPTHTNT